MSSAEIKKQELKKLLKIHYGFESFWPGQERVIDNILAGKDAVVIMPTGGGKSLCFQLPSLVLEGVTIVISPLIALMKDQVDSLNKISIPATFVNSSISSVQTNNRLDDVKRGKYKLLYIAPERFYNQEFMRALKEIKVSLLAVDEAHCISAWGHDFRPSYLKLAQAIKFLGRPTVVALTATATPEVRDDIIKQLDLVKPELIITGFARPNLQFGVARTNEGQKARLVIEAISSFPAGSGIIYVGTRARADQLMQILLDNDIEAIGYHAGMEAEERKWVQENFMRNKARVIVATNAFGLGIDKPDIRFVIHYDMPGTIEAYYQEAGRAGRDGKSSFCLLLYNSRDRALQEFFIKGDNPPPEIILEIYETLVAYESDKILITYAELADMLSDNLPEMAIGTALKILEREGYLSRSREKTGNAFLKFNQDFVSAKRLLSARAKSQVKLFEALVEKFGERLVNGFDFNFEELAEIFNSKRESIRRLIKKLEDEEAIFYRPPFRGTEINILQRVGRQEINLDFKALKSKLKHAYDKLNKMEEYVYHFACRPQYILSYFGDQAATACGRCDNCLAGRDGKFSDDQPSSNKDKTKLETKLTQMETFELEQQGLSIDEMAQARNLKPATIVEHLCWLIEKGLPIEIKKFVKPAKQKEIFKAIKKVGPDKLSPIKEAVGDEINWAEIKLVLAEYKKTHNT